MGGQNTRAINGSVWRVAPPWRGCRHGSKISGPLAILKQFFAQPFGGDPVLFDDGVVVVMIELWDTNKLCQLIVSTAAVLAKSVG